MENTVRKFTWYNRNLDLDEEQGSIMASAGQANTKKREIDLIRKKARKGQGKKKICVCVCVCVLQENAQDPKTVGFFPFFLCPIYKSSLPSPLFFSFLFLFCFFLFSCSSVFLFFFKNFVKEMNE